MKLYRYFTRLQDARTASQTHADSRQIARSPFGEYHLDVALLFLHRSRYGLGIAPEENIDQRVIDFQIADFQT